MQVSVFSFLSRILYLVVDFVWFLTKLCHQAGGDVSDSDVDGGEINLWGSLVVVFLFFKLVCISDQNNCVCFLLFF